MGFFKHLDGMKLVRKLVEFRERGRKSRTNKGKLYNQSTIDYTRNEFKFRCIISTTLLKWLVEKSQQYSENIVSKTCLKVKQHSC